MALDTKLTQIGKIFEKISTLTPFFILPIFLLCSEEVWTKNMLTFLSTSSQITVGKK
jgi:hypothetical protein